MNQKPGPAVWISVKRPPVREGQQCGKDQEFEETEDGKSQAEEEKDSFPCTEKPGEGGQQRNEDRK